MMVLTFGQTSTPIVHWPSTFVLPEADIVNREEVDQRDVIAMSCVRSEEVGVLCVLGKMPRYGVVSNIFSIKSFTPPTADIASKGGVER